MSCIVFVNMRVQLLLSVQPLLGVIIARPYVGEPGNFTRTSNRRDLAVSPLNNCFG